MNKGDKVRMLRDFNGGVPRMGDIGTVIDTDHTSFPYQVQWSSTCILWMRANEVERVSVTLAAPPVGMTSAQLAEYTDGFIRAAMARVNGVGSEQYETPEGQRFERMSPVQILEMAREEAQDLAVYAAMTDIRIARLIDALEAKNVAV
ncbi:hypothetical protein [Catellatospora sichuanensis]|uniref:hypothetical protein n=1 Tax=Catellatospora sichuanensis TaxID=1969805 RepID=UPI00118295A9|nr:hypothetical protein [Catellatospora sichuanensis]